MINRIVLAIMIVLLSVNLYAWNKLTVGNEKEIKKITRILDQCVNNSNKQCESSAVEEALVST